MPQAGNYECDEITHQVFCDILKTHHAHGDIESFIGYLQNANLIKQWTGIQVQLNRSDIQLDDEDRMLVMKLKYRIGEPTSKGAIVNPSDFQFFLICYHK